MKWRRLNNLPVIWLLRSPLHRIISSSVLLVTVQGWKTGRRYTTPVNYVRDGETLLVVSDPGRTWWRNLIGGAPVVMRLDGEDVRGYGEALTDPDEKRAAFRALIRQSPRYRRHLGIVLSPTGDPTNPEMLESFANKQILVRLSKLKFGTPVDLADDRRITREREVA